MKRITLVSLNTQFVHSSAVPYILSEGRDNVEIVEMTINDDVENVVESIVATKPEEILFSCYIWNRHMVERLISELKKIMPHALIAIGGPECISFRGNSLVDRIDAGDNLEYLENLENSVFMLGYFKRYCENIAGRILYLEASLGCPFSCSYCLASLSKGVRLVPMDIVKSMIDMAFDSTARQIKFVDRTFNFNQERAIEILKYIEKAYKERLQNGQKVKLGWHFEVAGDLFSQELLAMIKELPIGLVQFEVGIQSFSQPTLEVATRRTNLDKVLANISTLLSFKNVLVHTDLIAGLPLENLESFKNGFNLLHSIKPQEVQLGFLKVLPGSRLEEQAEKYGLVYSDFSPYEIWQTSALSFEDKQLLKAVEAVLERTWNNQRFIYTIEYLAENIYQGDFFKCYFDIAMHLKQKGLLGNPLSAVSMASELDEFAKGISGAHDKILIDLYTSSYPVKLPNAFKQEKMFTKEEIKALYDGKQKNEAAFTRLSDGSILEIDLREKNILTGKFDYRVFKH